MFQTKNSKRCRCERTSQTCRAQLTCPTVRDVVYQQSLNGVGQRRPTRWRYSTVTRLGLGWTETGHWTVFIGWLSCKCGYCVAQWSVARRRLRQFRVPITSARLHKTVASSAAHARTASGPTPSARAIPVLLRRKLCCSACGRWRNGRVDTKTRQ